MNVYMPSGKSFERRKERVELIFSLQTFLQSETYDSLIIAGDFNCILHQIDCTAPLIKSVDFHSLKNFIERENLIDSFRQLNGKTKSFTYIRHNTASRLDRIYISKTLQPKLREVTHAPITFSDHVLAPVARILFESNVSPLFWKSWKLNDSLLSIKRSKDSLKHTLEKWLDKPFRQENPLRWWDKLKKEIKYLFQKIGTSESLIRKRKKLFIQQRIQKATPEDTQALLDELRKIEKYEENGAFVRSRTDICDEADEIPNKFFFHLEKNKQEKTIITNLQHADSSAILINQAEIKEHIVQHFHSRWNNHPRASQLNLQQYLADVPTLTDFIELDTLQSTLITQDEIKLAIRSLHTNTSPGLDGLPPKFYQTFQDQLAPILQEVYNNMFLQHNSPDSQKTAIVKLIPKSGSKKDINNWRPISLLNCDYKILAKIISLRLSNTLSTYISESQQAAIKGRHIHNVLLNLKAAINYSKDKKHPLAFLQIDFSKAFDSLSHAFLLALMKHIQVPEQTIKWTSILLRNIGAKIQVNHELTEFIPVTSGIRQGCPLSMLLFALAADVLAKKLLAASSFCGLGLGSSSIKLQQFADDTTLLFTTPSEIKTAVQILNDFSNHSNLKINAKKTTVISNNTILTEEIRKYYPDAKFAEEAKILGILFSLHHPTAKKNWSKTIAIIKSTTDSHSHRNLSMFGKLTIIKTLLLPHITLMARIFNCPTNTQKAMSKIFFKFIWSPKVLEPISREVLCKIPKHGGIGMPCIKSWCNTAFAIRLKVIASSAHPDLFWRTYGIYNLGYHIRKIDPTLFTNSKPHRSEPNDDWKHLLSLYGQDPLTINQWTELTHKQTYHTFLDSHPAKLPTLTGRLQPTSWAEVLLLTKPYECLPNKQKEATYKVAHSGFFFGRFNRNHNINTFRNGQHRNNLCKFCSSPNDVTKHVFYECPVSTQILLKLQDFARRETHTQITLTKSTVLYNTCHCPAQIKVFILKLVAIYRFIVMLEKMSYDTFNQTVQDKGKFVSSVSGKILKLSQALIHDINDDSDQKGISIE